MTAEHKARELYNQVMEQINSEREKLAKSMVEKGYNPEQWAIVDNIEDIANGKTMEYLCYASLKDPLDKLGVLR